MENLPFSIIIGNNLKKAFYFVPETDFYQWDIDFYPRGVRYGKAQIINVYNNYNTNFAQSLEIPEVLLRVVRLSVTCKSNFEIDQRFMVNITPF